MRIGIDARWIRPQASGIGTYTIRLVEELLPIATPRHSITLLFDDTRTQARTLGRAPLAAALDAGTLDAIRVSFGPLSVSSQFRLPRVLAAHGIDLFHSTNYMIPLVGGPPSVATVHDLIPLLFPTPGSRSARLGPLYTGLLRQVARKAERLITVSEASARDLEKTLGIGGAGTTKLRTIPGGVGAEFKPSPEAPRPRTTDTRSVLYVGRSDPHKNLSGLLRAFAALRTLVDFEATLAVVGPEDPRFPEPRALAAELGIDSAVTWHGEIDDDTLLATYQHADVLCLPSHYEGFGLPAVEAMACATPVVCSNAGALPEVVGDAALLSPPDDPDALARALAQALTDTEGTARRIERGLARAARYTWAQTAAKTLRVYDGLDPDAPAKTRS